jgi:pyruvate-formate lyase-activating enzyme
MATAGCGKEGPTALLLSNAKLDLAESPDGHIADVILPASLAKASFGAAGIAAFLRSYFVMGGQSIHLNCFDPSTLRDAMAHPESYQDLQVRVCGGNVRWNDLSRREQLHFLATAEAQAGHWKLYGKPMSIPDIVAKAREDKVFYEQSGGGVTLSGGEPLFFWEWAVELFQAFKAEGFHTCLDTSLFAPPVAVEKMLPLVDLWLPDFKAENSDRHKTHTGVPNRIIKDNLKMLVKAKAKLEVRMLVVPGCTDGQDVADRHRYLRSIGIRDEDVVELEYLDLARSKYAALGMPDTMPPKSL